MSVTIEIFQNKVKTNALASVKALTRTLFRRHFRRRLKQFSYSVRPNQDLFPLIGMNHLKFSDTMVIPNPRKTVILGGFFHNTEDLRYAINLSGACKLSNLQFATHNISDFDQTLAQKISAVYQGIQKRAARHRSCSPNDTLQYSAWMSIYSDLLSPFFTNLPNSVAYIALHPLCAQAAVKSGIERVFYLVDDEFVSGVNIVDGAVHTCMALSDYYRIRSLHNMTTEKDVNHIPDSKMLYSGRVIDHTMAISLEKDSQRRISRLKKNQPLRIMVSTDSEGKFNEALLELLKKLYPSISENKASIYINLHDHRRLLELYRPVFEVYGDLVTGHTEIMESTEFLDKNILKPTSGLHFFLHEERISALYANNLLCRFADIAVMNPSGAGMYPVPKVLLRTGQKQDTYFSEKAFSTENALLSCVRSSDIYTFLKNCIDDKSYLEAANRKIYNSRLKYQGTLRLIEQINKKNLVESPPRMDVYKYLK